MTILNKITNELWEIQFNIRLIGGICLPSRTTIVQLKSGDLWVHSPGPATQATFDSIRALGDVRYIIAPNRYHHMYVGAFAAAFPNAEIWGAPGLAEKRKDLDFTSSLSEAHPWGTEIDARFIDGAPILNETTFFHQSSNTMICTDLLFNIVEFENLITKLLFLPTGAGRGLVQSRSWWMFTKNRKQVGEATANILEWDFDRILMGHGDAVEGTDLRKRVSEIVRWLPEERVTKLIESAS